MKKPRIKYEFVAPGNKLRHRLIAEKILGRPLRGRECVHHFDGDGLNNSHENLVICPDGVYHQLLHTRERALAACGNANFKRCTCCGEWDDPANMKSPRPTRFVHLECERKRLRQWYAKHKVKVLASMKRKFAERYTSDPVFREQHRERSRLSMQRHFQRKKVEALE
jgi:hypothetical protein